MTKILFLIHDLGQGGVLKMWIYGAGFLLPDLGAIISRMSYMLFLKM